MRREMPKNEHSKEDFWRMLNWIWTWNTTCTFVTNYRLGFRHWSDYITSWSSVALQIKVMFGNRGKEG